MGTSKNFTPVIRHVPDPAKRMGEEREEARELRKCLRLVFGLFLAQKNPPKPSKQMVHLVGHEQGFYAAFWFLHVSVCVTASPSG